MKFKIILVLIIFQFSLNSFSENPQLKDTFVPSNSPAVEKAVQSTSTTLSETIFKKKDASSNTTSKKHDKSLSKTTENSKTAKIVEIKKPSLKKGEYAYFDNDKYFVFNTIEHNKLEINSDCPKKNGVYDCLAAKSDSLPSKEKNRILPGQTNPAANYCLSISGDGIIATDYMNNEISFCKFSDNSLVRAWSLQHKLFPLTEIK